MIFYRQKKDPDHSGASRRSCAIQDLQKTQWCSITSRRHRGFLGLIKKHRRISRSIEYLHVFQSPKNGKGLLECKEDLEVFYGPQKNYTMRFIYSCLKLIKNFEMIGKKQHNHMKIFYQKIIFNFKMAFIFRCFQIVH